MPKILVIGECGQLARSLGQLDWPPGTQLEFVGRRRLAADFVGPAAAAAVGDTRPALVLNTAAYTAVDRAEDEPEAAAALNAGLPQAVADACRALDIPFVHISTDYVFDGTKRSPYMEADPTNPLNVYGRTKLDGDRAIEQARLPRWAVLRTSWVVSEIGETFPVKLLRRARAGEPLRVVDDQFGCPTSAGELARAMRDVGLRLMDGDEAARGLFNFCGASTMSWHGLAERLLDVAASAGLVRPPLVAISTAELQAPARRPAYSVLSCVRLAEACGITNVGIEADIGRMVHTILAT